MAHMMDGSAGSIGSSTASTMSIGTSTASTVSIAASTASPVVDCSDMEDSEPSLSTAAENEESKDKDHVENTSPANPDIDDSDPFLSTATENEENPAPASNLEPWHYTEGSLREKFIAWQKYESPEDWGPLEEGSYVYQVITDKGTFFAVKEFSLLDQGSQGNKSLSLLEQRIEFLKQLEHENIVQYIGTNKDNEKLYVFLEIMSRGSLSTFYRKYGLIKSQVSAHTRKILEGLKYLHSQNEILRDIRCANILVGASGSVKLDFQLANAFDLHDANSFGGNIFWLAPEVVQVVHDGRNGSYGSAADIWSLGCTVLEIFTSNRPYSEFGDGEAVARIYEGKPPGVPQSLPGNARDFICKCLQVDPKDRLSAAELLIHPFVRR